MKIVQVNIEHNKHLDKIQKFIQQESPDVITMQEVLEPDFEHMKSVFNMHGVFIPMFLRNGIPQGTATFSKVKITHTQIEYYYKQQENLVNFASRDQMVNTSFHFPLLTIKAIFENKEFTILNTHFPVHYPGHEVSDFQRECFEKMQKLLDSKADFILAGDTNCPRGTEIFDTLASKYKDNVPQDADTSLDKNFHRAGYLPYVVDCLFSTPEYTVKNVKLVDGLSDHMAIVAEVEKNL